MVGGSAGTQEWPYQLIVAGIVSFSSAPAVSGSTATNALSTKKKLNPPRRRAASDSPRFSGGATTVLMICGRTLGREE